LWITPIGIKRLSVPQPELCQLASRRSSSAKASIRSFAATVCWPGTSTTS